MKEARRAGEGVRRGGYGTKKRGAPADGIVQLKGHALTPQAVSLSMPGTWAGAPPPRCNQYTMSTEQRSSEGTPMARFVLETSPWISSF
jgi:hypothetical protein